MQSKNTKEKSLEIEQQKKIQKHKKYKRQIFQRLKRVEYQKEKWKNTKA